MYTVIGPQQHYLVANEERMLSLPRGTPGLGKSSASAARGGAEGGDAGGGGGGGGGALKRARSGDKVYCRFN